LVFWRWLIFSQSLRSYIIPILPIED
jgi:hypothetical protein